MIEAHRWQRVAVVGTSGAGKSVFSARLASLLGTTHVELDALYWGPNWTPRTDFVPAVAAAARQAAWVIDGNYSKVRAEIWSRCTTIVWLDYSFARVFGRALGRTLRQVTRSESIHNGNRVTLARTFLDPEGVPWWVVRTYRRRRREIPRLARSPEYAHARLIALRNPAAAQALLQRIARPLPP